MLILEKQKAQDFCNSFKGEADSLNNKLQDARKELISCDERTKEARRDKISAEADRRRILKECDDKIALAQKKEQDAEEAVKRLNSLMSNLKK